MKVIKVKYCAECPYCTNDNGGGYCEPFIICEKFNIILDEYIKDSRFINLDEEIHPDCKLEDDEKIYHK